MTSELFTSRRLALLSGFALLAVVGVGSVCSAESPWPRRGARPAPPPYRLSLVQLDGSALPTFRHAGATFVLGDPGERYNIRVDNPTAERVEAVISVDGRDAISGGVGDYVRQRGYLIEPWGSVVVEGFRRSLDEVAAFRFTDAGASYSARRGTPQNVGVIGVAIFPEKPRPRPVLRRPVEPESRAWPPAAERDAPRSAPAPARERAPYDRDGGDAAPRKSSSRGSAGPSNIGTEYGESQSSSVVEVAFERRSPTRPSFVLQTRYDDYDGLASRGIDLSSLGYAANEPEPFPYARSRFASPP